MQAFAPGAGTGNAEPASQEALPQLRHRAVGSYICAASTSTPAAVIHSRVTSMIPSSSPTRSFLGNRQAALHELNQDVGRDTLGRKDRLRAAIGVGSDELERRRASCDAGYSIPGTRIS